jgi:hypothetical protein
VRAITIAVARMSQRVVNAPSMRGSAICGKGSDAKVPDIALMSFVKYFGTAFRHRQFTPASGGAMNVQRWRRSPKTSVIKL